MGKLYESLKGHVEIRSCYKLASITRACTIERCYKRGKKAGQMKRRGTGADGNPRSTCLEADRSACADKLTEPHGQAYLQLGRLRAVLEFEVRQLYLSDEERYYLPIPKLSQEQFSLVGADMSARGFHVSAGTQLRARMDDTRLVVSQSGIAWSSSDLLDSLLPSVACALSLPKVAWETNPYFVSKRNQGSFALHFFPRLEGSGLWDALRRQGACGLTPDEAVVLRHVLADHDEDIDCLTDYPTEGCSPTQAGRHAFYRSRISASEFLVNLRTISEQRSRNTYLPRSSVLGLKKAPKELDSSTSSELGQWCYLEPPTKTSN